MWNRARYDRGKMRYPSDVTDEEWALVEPHIPPARRGGGKRTVVMREVVNGLMYVLSTGCQWAAIPEDLPPKSTVYDYFDLWSWDGTLDRIHEALYVRQPGLSRSWLPIRQKSDCRISFEVADQRAVSCVAKPSHRCRQSQAEDRSEAPAADETARRLTSIPGVGPLIAATVRATINDIEGFKTGRDFAAWLGLTPRLLSSGGKEKLGAISKQGNRQLRTLLVVGASSIIKQAKRGVPLPAWLAGLLARKP